MTPAQIRQQYEDRLKSYSVHSMRAAAFRGLAESIGLDDIYTNKEKAVRLRALCQAANEADEFWDARLDGETEGLNPQILTFPSPEED